MTPKYAALFFNASQNARRERAASNQSAAEPPGIGGLHLSPRNFVSILNEVLTMKNHTLPLFAAFVAGALMLPAASTAVADSQTLAQAEQSNHPDRHGPPGKVRPHRHKAGSASDSAATPGQAKHTSQQHGAPGKRKTNPHPAAGKGAEASNPAAVEHGSDEAKRPKPRRPKGAAGKTPQRR